MKKISDDCWQSFFIKTFSTCTTILGCNVKIKQTFDYYAVQKSKEYMEGLLFSVLYCIADHGGGGVLVLLSFYACHLCVSLIVAILNFH